MNESPPMPLLVAAYTCFIAPILNSLSNNPVPLMSQLANIQLQDNLSTVDYSSTTESLIFLVLALIL